MNKDYNFLSKLFLRAPYYSFNGYDLNRLPEVLQQQDFLNAVWLASPGFYEILQKQGFIFDKLNPRQTQTLYKYYNRMCFRPTPFGGFASFTLLNWGDGQPLKLSGGLKSRLHLLPDQQLMAAPANSATGGELAGDLTVNPCLYPCNGTFRYFKSAAESNGRYNFSLAAIEANDFNTALLARVSSGTGLPGLIRWICERGECSSEEARDYLQFLIEEQVLLTGKTGAVICHDPFLQAIRPIPGWDAYWKKYKTAGMDSMRLADLAGTLQNLLKTPSPDQRLFYAGLERDAESGGPGMADQEKLLAALQVIRLLNADSHDTDLAGFKSEFSRRYDLQKIPLLAALDPDTGIRYGDLSAPETGHGHLDDLPFPDARAGEPKPDWGSAHQLLFRVWISERQREPWSPIVLSTADILELERKKDTRSAAPQTQVVMYRNTGEHLLIEHAGGVAATSLIGRFSAFSPEVHDFCCELAAIEIGANPDVVFADIAQLSDLHVDNINRRRPVYDYEIPVNVYSTMPAEAQLPPADLLLSMRSGELILESARLGLRVIPRLSTAYNFRHNNLPVFRLLCDLQYQGLNTGSALKLEHFFPGLRFYPRLCTAEVVLSLATWKFSGDDLAQLRAAGAQDRMNALKTFRDTHRLPRYISLGDTDQQLVFDLAINAEVDFFLACTEGLHTVTVQEYFYPDRSVTAGSKPLCGQYIAFLAHRDKVYEGAVPDERAFSVPVSRSFMAGSEWLYLKIFCSPRVADDILVSVIRPFLYTFSGVRQWFFIRYNEHEDHLRIRFHGEPARLALVLPELSKRLVTGGFDGQIRDYQADTYRREIERYGAGLIPQMEELFRTGSDLVTDYLYYLNTGGLELDRFKFALVTAKLMSHCYFADVAECHVFLKSVTASFLKEFKADKAFKVSLDQRYRALAPEMDALPDRSGFPEEIARHFDRLTAVITDIRRLQPGAHALLADAIHMQLNRTFSIQQRRQELLVYYYLEKYTASGIARSRAVR